MEKIYLLFLALLTTSCASIGTNPKGSLSKSLIKSNRPLNISTDAMKKELTRSGKIVGWRSGSLIKATLMTPVYREKMERKRVESESFKYKWSDEEKQKQLDKIPAAIQASAGRTCFLTQVATDDYSALDSKAWHGELVQGAKISPVQFSKFSGFTKLTKWTNQSGLVGETRKHFLYSMACAEAEINSRENIVFVILPRFKKDIKPIRLEWDLVETEKSEGLEICSPSEVKPSLPMLFKKFQITCKSECAHKVHPLNKKKCEERFDRHIRNL